MSSLVGEAARPKGQWKITCWISAASAAVKHHQGQEQSIANNRGE